MGPQVFVHNGKDGHKKKICSAVLTGLLAPALCSCGSSGDSASASSSQSSAESATSQEQEYDPAVDNIDLSLDGGSIRFDHVEKANAELTDSDNALVFVFEFTNAQSTPASVQSVFSLQFFQNGAELTNNLSCSSEGGDQYELIDAFFNEALKDGSVTFGRIVEPKDDSPITVMASSNGYALEDNYQTMEVAIDGLGTSNTAEADSASSGDATRQALNIGDTASNDQFTVTLTDARVDSTLSSSDSSTYWTPSDGGAFVILEFDVTALTSDQLPVDDYAITDLTANYNEDIYANWIMQYISGQIWCYFRHTHLDANLPCHVYAYTTVPAGALNSGALSVDLDVAGTSYTVTIH